MNEIRVAVVGAGILGKRHARVFGEIEGARLVAVADHSLEKAQAAAGEARAFTSIEELLSNVECDAVAVATPDHLHVDPVTSALNAGKHVLVEKPLATSMTAARDMSVLAQRKGLVLQVNYSQRWVPEYTWIKQQIAAGTIGQPRLVQSSKQDTIYVPTRMINWAAHTSPIWFMSSHDIDLISWFLEDRVTSVLARETRGVLEGLGIGTHDGVDALVHYASGATLALHSSWIHPESYPVLVVDRMTIVGDSGVIEFQSRGRQIECYARSGGTTMSFNGPQTATEVNGKLEGAFRSSLLAFLSSIVTGQEPPTSAARTMHVVEIQAAILEAARQAAGIPLTTNS